MVAGDIQLVKQMGGVKKVLMDTFSGEKTEGRTQQLPAVFIVAPDMKIQYAHYAGNLSDIPDIAQLLA